MAWTRNDDNEPDHPKIIALIERVGYEGYYRLHRLHGYCARHKTDGLFSESSAKEQGVRPRVLLAMMEVGLVDKVAENFQIHDWNDYNGRDPKMAQAERSKRYRDRHSAVTSAVTPSVTAPLLARDEQRDDRRDENVTSRARIPNPNPDYDDDLVLPDRSKPPSERASTTDPARPPSDLNEVLREMP